MLTLASARLTAPAVAGRGLNEGLGVSVVRTDYLLATFDA
jgi:hypothetical protein